MTTPPAPLVQRVADDLQEVVTYFAEREDADHDGERFVGNEAMTLLRYVRSALAALDALARERDSAVDALEREEGVRIDAQVKLRRAEAEARTMIRSLLPLAFAWALHYGRSHIGAGELHPDHKAAIDAARAALTPPGAKENEK